MPYKDSEKNKAAQRISKRKYYEKNKQKVIDAAAILKVMQRLIWAEFKSTLACEVCGFSHPAVLDFHHPPGVQKEGAVSSLAASSRWAAVYAEVAKCIVMCANCHRIHHYNEHQNKKGAEAPLWSTHDQDEPGEPKIPSGSLTPKL